MAETIVKWARNERNKWNTEQASQETMFEATLAQAEESQPALDDLLGPVEMETDGEIQIGTGDMLTIGGEEQGELLFPVVRSALSSTSNSLSKKKFQMLSAI